jgi:hypothetical protein
MGRNHGSFTAFRLFDDIIRKRIDLRIGRLGKRPSGKIDEKEQINQASKKLKHIADCLG